MENIIAQADVYQVLSSDHYPVVAEVGSSVNRHRTTRRKYHRANWERFRQYDDESVDFDVRPE